MIRSAKSGRHNDQVGKKGVALVVAQRRAVDAAAPQAPWPAPPPPARPSPTRTARRRGCGVGLAAHDRHRFAPAEPIGVSSASTAAATTSANPGGRDPLTTTGRAGGAGGEPGDRLDGCRVRRVGHPERGQGDRTGGEETGTAVAARSPQRDVHGQSTRPLPYSRVPSTGSTIHTREASRRDKSSADSSLSTESSGRRRASNSCRKSSDCRSPASPSSRRTAPTRRAPSSTDPRPRSPARRPVRHRTGRRSTRRGWPSHNPRSRSIASATSPAGPSSG